MNIYLGRTDTHTKGFAVNEVNFDILGEEISTTSIIEGIPHLPSDALDKYLQQWATKIPLLEALYLLSPYDVEVNRFGCVDFDVDESGLILYRDAEYEWRPLFENGKSVVREVKVHIKPPQNIIDRFYKFNGHDITTYHSYIVPENFQIVNYDAKKFDELVMHYSNLMLIGLDSQDLEDSTLTPNISVEEVYAEIEQFIDPLTLLGACKTNEERYKTVAENSFVVNRVLDKVRPSLREYVTFMCDCYLTDFECIKQARYTYQLVKYFRMLWRLSENERLRGQGAVDNA